MTFTTPLALLLLISLPVILALGWPRVRHRRARDTASLILRMLILLLLIFALAGAQIVRPTDRLAVVFVIDTSDSVGPDGIERGLAYIREALAAMPPDDRAAVIAFGANALVERPLSAARELGPLRSTPISSNTNIEEALGLALALFPADAAKRIVLISDGQATLGDALAPARRAAVTGVEISYVTLERDPQPEVYLRDMRVPTSVSAGQVFDLSMTIVAEEPGPALVSVFADGRLIFSEGVQLEAGANNYALALQAGETGFSDFRVQVDPQGQDGFYQNNQLAAFARVTGPPRVLLVAADDDEARYLTQAFEELGLAVDRTAPAQLPIGVATLANYDSVVLANIPATALPRQRMDLLNTFVRDLGGGLVVIGGPEAYGPGGYFQTPLEDALPVESQIRDQQRLPQLTIVYVIDRSGSMSMIGPSGVENLELAKEAIIRSIDFLQPTDRAGVVSFDTAGVWIAEIQPVFDRIALQLQVAAMRAGGGTDILAGLRLAAEALRDDPSERKHIILLTDGIANPTQLVELTRDLYQNADVTTSVIAIGSGFQPFMREMAREGGGNYHEVELIEAIPTIFTQEAVLATRSYIFEEAFTPGLSASSPIMSGIGAAPPLLGYVATTPRQTAQVILRGPAPYFDPILASWQYGLGRVVAFTSDATARWAANWVAWPDFARFWNQAVQWTITESAADNLEARLIMEDERARVIVDARDEASDFRNGLQLEARVVDPRGNGTSVALRQTAPGLYEGTFLPETEGAYFIRIGGIDLDGTPVNQTIGWVRGYSAEYRPAAGGAALLEEIAALTGGRSLAEAPAEVFARTLTAAAAQTPIWPYLLLLALLLLPADIAVRRLLLLRGDFDRLRQAIWRRPAPSLEGAERLSSLMDAKARAARKLTAEPPVDGAPAAPPARPPIDRPAETAVAERSPQPVPEAQSVSASPPAERSNLAGELLKRRKRE